MHLNNSELEHGRCLVTTTSVTKRIWKEVAIFAVKSPSLGD